MRVLIIEDDHQLRPLQRALVEELGHEADEATNARDGLAMLKGDPEIELVMLDLGLPPDPQDITEGLWFLEQARLWNALLKVIVVSGQSHEDAQLRCVEAGAFDVLSKPFSKERLEFALSKAAFFSRSERTLRNQGGKFPVMVVADVSSEEGLKMAREEVVERIVRTTLGETGHNVSEAARRLGITREHLYYYIKKYGIVRPDEER